MSPLKLPEQKLTPFEQWMAEMGITQYPNFTDTWMQKAYEAGVKYGLTHAIQETRKAKERNR